MARTQEYGAIIVDLLDRIDTQISDMYSVEFHREVFLILDKDVRGTCVDGLGMDDTLSTKFLIV